MPHPGSVSLPPCRELTWRTTTHQLVDDLRFPLATEVSYRSHDPFAVRFAFQLPEEAVVWDLERDMLRFGTEAPAGGGDIRIRPAPYNRTLLRLGAVGNYALVLVERTPLLRFLDRTFEVVAPGTEGGHIDWGPLYDARAD
ncbi:Sporulation and cell division protein [Streptomyces sp. ADI96-02]|uniref:SsgA family sporulation/cell division regulator n=1 Tax=unclassified Streptomyces TaxID=2593676 RepID=UPI000F54D4A4|nr:SsgA family sporulation/cell division regulator [Streptomyces sp. ADI96-02]RPK61322.1 Sporulation and cell division protein [Streptomyces sp. ADI96-02]